MSSLIGLKFFFLFFLDETAGSGMFWTHAELFSLAILREVRLWKKRKEERKGKKQSKNFALLRAAQSPWDFLVSSDVESRFQSTHLFVSVSVCVFGMWVRCPPASGTIRMSPNLDQYLTMDRSKPHRSCTLFILISWLFEHSSQGPSQKWALTGLHTYPHTHSLSFPALVSYSLSLSYFPSHSVFLLL